MLNFLCCCQRRRRLSDDDSLPLRSHSHLDAAVLRSHSDAGLPHAFSREQDETAEVFYSPRSISGEPDIEAAVVNTDMVLSADASIARTETSADAGEAGTAEVSPEAPASKTGLLSSTVYSFRACLSHSDHTMAQELRRADFLDGLLAYSAVLNSLGEGMGSYLDSNIKKLTNSKASSSLSGYREWLLSELPTHSSTGYKCYADESAWMANLWIGWTLEFFVEFFAQLLRGLETKHGIEAAYKCTLYNHHNFFQRKTFSMAMGRLPGRDAILEALRGTAGADENDVLRELDEFVSAGRTIVHFCLQVNEELDQRLKEQRQIHVKA
eukprot:TRINITY_DN94995_c0_g1_i1.p1 TRINITY_DN94995_c0_g1~~TRINITY_DN94995_c0_g1_i1.p1  ORF type:complete len:325 (+),score=50.90 TRINITY_DN94995_c0_g1_i1:17-991(+)